MKKIFLLEDDFSLNESIKEMLEESGFVVDTFYNGQKAFDNIFGNYMLYIFDINVPNIDGITLLEKVKSMNPSAKVIIISANIDIDKITPKIIDDFGENFYAFKDVNYEID